jgi:ABC-type Na+ transport system ATPase subunit NatA
MGFRYDINRLTKLQVMLAYKSDIAELERKCDSLFNAIEHYKYFGSINGLGKKRFKAKIDELERRLDIYKLELEALKTELELVLF